MKTFSIYPLADLNKEIIPENKQVMLPAGSTVESHQYANHVYLMVHCRTNQTRTVMREIIFAVPFQEVPDDHEHIGTIIANEALGPEEDMDENSEPDEDSEIIEEVPTNPEEFYSVLALINVYISPEKSVTGRDGKSWSFIKELR
jgi:hypothetical protein